MTMSAPRGLIMLVLMVLSVRLGEAVRVKRGKVSSEFRMKNVEVNTMEETESSESMRATVMKLAKPKLGGKLNITRPSTGGKVYSGTPVERTLGQSFREYLVVNGRGPYTTSSNNCINPAFTRKGDGRMCGVGLFSKPRLQCTYMTQPRLDSDYRKFDKLKPATSRGLGLEFEFVAQEQASNIAGVKNCFTKITRKLTPRNLPKWNWEKDNSVTPITSAEAKSIGAPVSETRGVPFEVTSPGPPNVVSGGPGFRAAIDMLTGLRHMGLQAGPSQGFHVHTNVFGDAGGKKLYRRQAFYVWAAWAKFQFAIDEMFSPSRPGSHFAQRLFLGNCKPVAEGTKCNVDPCGCNRRFFGNMHKWLKDHPSQPEIDKPRSKETQKFCNTILGIPGSMKACEYRYPHQRYFQVNMVPMNKFGTLEFRPHSATYSRGRVLRWVQFVIAFVEHFGLGGGKATGMSRYFTKGTAASDYRRLQRAQQTATSDELFKQLKGKIASDSKAYFQQRKWELSSMKGCNIGGVNTWRADPGVGGQACGSLAASSASSLLQEDVEEDQHAWHTPTLVSKDNRTRVMHVSVPSNRKPGSYLMVEMPEGNVRAELLHEKSVQDGIHQFTYDLTDEDIAEHANTEGSLMQAQFQSKEFSHAESSGLEN